MEIGRRERPEQFQNSSITSPIEAGVGARAQSGVLFTIAILKAKD
jgi:hypothetical protein